MKEKTKMSEELKAMSVGRTASIIKCVLMMACSSILFTWSIFVNPVIAYHGWDLVDVAYVGTLNSAGYFVGICVGGNIYTRLGAKRTFLLGTILLGVGLILSSFVSSASPLMIYLTYGCIAGMGVGTIYNAGMFAARDWFPDNKGLAMGISLAAFGGGGAFLAPLCSVIINRFGINTTFIILGVVFLVVGLVCGSTFKTAPEEYLNYADELRQRELASNTQRNYTLAEAFRTRQFWCHAFGMAFRVTMYSCMSSFFVVYGIENGMSQTMATFAVSACAISQIITRLGLGALADKFHWRKVYLHHFICSTAALLCLVVFKSITPVLILIGYMFLASTYCGTSITNPIIDALTFGPRTSPAIFGTALLFGVPAHIIMPRISMAIMESTGSFTPMIIFGFIVTVIADISSYSVTPIKQGKFPEVSAKSHTTV